MSEQPVHAYQNLQQHLPRLLALFAVQAIYFPINRLITDGIVLDTPLDPLIPVWPVWAIPYLLGLVWWEACIIWAAAKMDERRFNAFFMGALFTMLTSYIVYIIFPTFIVRQPVVGHGWQYDLLRAIYANDQVYNAFPSGHTYNSILIVLFWWDWRPRLRLWWVIIASLVLLSTLFTGQHNLPDLVGGILWAWMGYRFGLWRAKKGSSGVICV
jgi:membrane-associated phospholipid phosphatase